MARRLAELSGGRAITSARDVPGMIESIHQQSPTRIERLEWELWDTPLLFVLIVLVAGTEWLIRRRRRLI